MKLTLRELSQLPKRSFRAAGFTFGEADSLAKSIRWLEIYEESGLQILHKVIHNLEDLRDQSFSVKNHSASFVTIEAAENRALTNGLAALDLCTAKANTSGVGIVYSNIPAEDQTAPTLGHSVYAAAERGLFSLILISNQEGSTKTVLGVPDNPFPIIAEASFKTPTQAHERLFNILTDQKISKNDSPLEQAFFSMEKRGRQRSTDDAHLLSRILSASMTVNSDNNMRDSGFVQICFDPMFPNYSGEFLNVPRDHVEDHSDSFDFVREPEEIAEKVDKYVSEGLSVDREVWEDIVDYNRRRLLPIFQGSEKGAGVALSDPLSLQNVAEDAWALTAPTGATLEAKDGTIVGDIGQVRSLFESIFNTAINHNQQATVHIGPTETGFYVEDTSNWGQLDDSTKIDYHEIDFQEGSGDLELAIVERVAKAHEWDYSLNKLPEGGLRFEFNTENSG